MSRLSRLVNGNFDQIIRDVTDEILHGSISATLEESDDFSQGTARCSVRVFQAEDGPVCLSAITSGGSQAVFTKINTVGEETFLEKLRDALDRLYPCDNN